MKRKTQQFQIDSGPWAGQHITLSASFRETALLRIGPSLGRYKAEFQTSRKPYLTWHPHWTAPVEDLYP